MNFKITNAKDYTGTLIMHDFNIKKFLHSLSTLLTLKALFFIESCLCVVSFLEILETWAYL